MDRVVNEGGSLLDQYRLKHADIALGEGIGEGSFGTVYKGVLKGKGAVAVKTVRTTRVTESSIVGVRPWLR